MPEWLAEFGRIWLAVAFAMYGFVLYTTIKFTKQALYVGSLMLLSFVASAVVLFHSVLVRLPGWPALLTAIWVTMLVYGTGRYAHQRYGRRAHD